MEIKVQVINQRINAKPEYDPIYMIATRVNRDLTRGSKLWKEDLIACLIKI